MWGVVCSQLKFCWDKVQRANIAMANDGSDPIVLKICGHEHTILSIPYLGKLFLFF
jgi:hypothetical protein